MSGQPHPPRLELGNPRVNAQEFGCCGKPRGCNMTHEGCAYLRHPWKRAMVFGDLTVRCQMTAWDDGEWWQCTLLNGHAGACQKP